MNDKDIDGFRARLEQERAQLHGLESTSKEATQTVELDQASVGRLLRMDAMQGQQMALETARRRELELRAIDGALRRIESGECFHCGEEIPVERLNADPTATRCIGCVGK